MLDEALLPQPHQAYRRSGRAAHAFQQKRYGGGAALPAKLRIGPQLRLKYERYLVHPFKTDVTANKSVLPQTTEIQTLFIYVGSVVLLGM